MWLKKKAFISGYNSNTAYDGTDWRTNSNNNSWAQSNTLPSAADAGNYFYLPALGWYESGQLKGVGGGGGCWSSSAHPWGIKYAYRMYFTSAQVLVVTAPRSYGIRVEPTFE